ncbi:hypothetical protein DVU_1383 [Nitratidesulfovibrio vulgaris str. Hildenborough]|uniref:Uncharacterized protein n=1 Tax=Nitratidesulfovibrio vulgaris (strain ATCC 29579 / DSM 644 / CCUG 34227 / NCIMB 8303 / VKM B-1760 / Hildenborough) TaxID=882 RepID=Q72CA1_NITV2|nr:hypothetical protein DVU_1383 [Nitratidesulfovibrio vulgaris str. Hildenborough]
MIFRGGVSTHGEGALRNDLKTRAFAPDDDVADLLLKSLADDEHVGATRVVTVVVAGFVRGEGKAGAVVRPRGDVDADGAHFVFCEVLVEDGPCRFFDGDHGSLPAALPHVEPIAETSPNCHVLPGLFLLLERGYRTESVTL